MSPSRRAFILLAKTFTLGSFWLPQWLEAFAGSFRKARRGVPVLTGSLVNWGDNTYSQ